MSIKNDSIYLYKGFRPYVAKKKLAQYDNTFFSRQRYNIKFMTSFINEFVNIKYYYKRPRVKEDGYLFNFFIHDFSQRNSKNAKAINDFKNTPRMLDINFMYSNK